MYPLDAAVDVSTWPALGIELPTDVVTALAVFDASRYVEVSHQPVVKIEDVTPENAEAAIRELADQLVVATTADGAVGLSPVQRAKNQVVAAAAHKVVSAARVAVPSIIESLTPTFDRHADSYAAAVRKLPDDLNADSLLDADAEAFAAYKDAQREVLYLARVAGWVGQLPYLSGILGVEDPDVALYILRPETAAQLVAIDAARREQANSTLAAIGQTFFTAVKLGIPFGINTPAEASALRAELLSLAPAH